MKKILALCFLLIGCQSFEHSISDSDNNLTEIPEFFIGEQVELVDFDKYEFVKSSDDKTLIVQIKEETEAENVEEQKYKWTDKIAECPLNTVRECLVWLRKKPIKETSYMEDEKIKLSTIIHMINDDDKITGTTEEFSELVDRYKLILKLSKVCCRDNSISQMEYMGLKKETIYKFLEDDIVNNNIAGRCLFYRDTEEKDFDIKNIKEMLSNAQKSCICINAKQIKDMMKPFEKIVELNPEFKNKKFPVVITDGLNRSFQYDINTDLSVVQKQLSKCYK